MTCFSELFFSINTTPIRQDLISDPWIQLNPWTRYVLHHMESLPDNRCTMSLTPVNLISAYYPVKCKNSWWIDRVKPERSWRLGPSLTTLAFEEKDLFWSYLLLLTHNNITGLYFCSFLSGFYSYISFFNFNPILRIVITFSV